MILGKHTGRAAVIEKLRERGITAPDTTIVDLLARLKEGAESRSKEETRRFLQAYRARFERPGLSDEEFWLLADAVGIRTADA
jgi:isopropylmalate/homocitrate/citramalate synthase